MKRFHMANGSEAKSGSASASTGARWQRFFSVLAVTVILTASGWPAGDVPRRIPTLEGPVGRLADFVECLSRRASFGDGGDRIAGAAPAFEGRGPAALSPHGIKPVVPAESPPLITVIIDDIGYEKKVADKLIRLDSNLTFSVLPHAPYTADARRRLREEGREIMLHLPMEGSGRSGRRLGKGALKLNMSPFLIKRIVDEDLAAVPEATGVNNHMGSRFTRWRPGMKAVLEKLSRRGLYFVDSVTDSHSVAYDMARKMGLPCSKRDVFLDHDDSVEIIERQWNKLLNRARKNGKALAIGHPRFNTYRVLKRRIPQLKYEGLSLVPASRIVETAREGA